jgi:hypothetical protein
MRINRFVIGLIPVLVGFSLQTQSPEQSITLIGRLVAPWRLEQNQQAGLSNLTRQPRSTESIGPVLG